MKNMTRLEIHEKDFTELSKQLKRLEAYRLTDDYKNEPIKLREALDLLYRAEKVRTSALAEVISILKYEETHR